jgi:hypothetical protein
MTVASQWRIRVSFGTPTSDEMSRQAKTLLAEPQGAVGFDFGSGSAKADTAPSGCPVSR